MPGTFRVHETMVLGLRERASSGPRTQTNTVWFFPSSINTQSSSVSHTEESSVSAEFLLIGHRSQVTGREWSAALGVCGYDSTSLTLLTCHGSWLSVVTLSTSDLASVTGN